MTDTHVSAAIVKVRLAIHEIDAELADLREHRNHRAVPLCRIPNELIIKIYHEFQAQWIDEYDEYDLLIGPIPWWGEHLSLCRRIRSITQQASELWTFIHIYKGDDDRNLNWRTTCLQRARDAHLTLRIYLPHLSDVPRDILPLACRTFKLDIYMLHDTNKVETSPSRLESLLGGIFTAGAQWPILRRANIMVTANPFTHVAWIRPSFLGGSQNTIHSLTLNKSKVSWAIDQNAPVLHNLRDLDIEGLKVSDIRQLLKWLSCMPLLSSIRLVLTRGSVLTPGHQAPLHLERLRFLELQGATTQLLSILPFFPDPLEELALNTLFEEEDQTQLIDYAASYLARQKLVHTFTVRYELKIKEGQQSRSAQGQLIYTLRPDSPGPSPSQMMFMGRLRLQGRMATLENIFDLLKSAGCTVISVSPGCWGIIEDVISFMPTSLESQITVIEIMLRTPYPILTWNATNDTCLSALKMHLTMRKEQGCQLKTLFLRAKDSFLFMLEPLASAWLKEGLVERIVVKRIRTFSGLFGEFIQNPKFVQRSCQSLD
jgi:hypothetical protein